MKKMLAIMAVAAGMQGVRADDAPDNQGDCAKPTIFVMQALSASAIPENASSDWVDQLQKGASFTTNMIGTHMRTESVGGVTDAQYAQAERAMHEGKDIGHGKQVARFDVKQINDTQVSVQSEIEIVDPRQFSSDEAWQSFKAMVEEKGSYNHEKEVDKCTACSYNMNVVMNDLSRESRLYFKASCTSILNKDELVAKLKAERAAVAKLRVDSERIQKQILEIQESMKKIQDQN